MTTDTPTPSPTLNDEATPKLSTLDRLLPVWIGSAMVGGILLGRLIPDLNDTLDKVKVDTVSLPIAIGLLAMMYPVLAKVRYRGISAELGDRRTMGLSLVLNWVVGPALMFTLAWVFLGDLPELRTGLIIVGLARCIAMVLIWNDLACGNSELGAVLVAVNSVFQIVMYTVLGWFYLDLLPGWLGLETQSLDVGMWPIAKSVLIFLGIPLVAGFLRVPSWRPARAPTGTSTRSSPASAPSPSTGCCSPSWCCSRCRATRFSTARSTWPGWPCRS